jgi:hypothetical protein
MALDSAGGSEALRKGFPDMETWIMDSCAAYDDIKEPLWLSWSGALLQVRYYREMEMEKEAREVEANRERAEQQASIIEMTRVETARANKELFDQALAGDITDQELAEGIRKNNEVLEKDLKELKSGVQDDDEDEREVEDKAAGKRKATDANVDVMDVDAMPATEADTPPARKREAKHKHVEFVEQMGTRRCDRCLRGEKECLVPDGEQRCQACNNGHFACSFARPRKADEAGETRAKKKQTQAGLREASGSSGGTVRAGAYVGKPPPAALGAEVTRACAVGERAASGEDMEWLEAQRGAIRWDILILRDQIAAKQGALAVLEGQLARLG